MKPKPAKDQSAYLYDMMECYSSRALGLPQDVRFTSAHG